MKENGGKWRETEGEGKGEGGEKGKQEHLVERKGGGGGRSSSWHAGLGSDAYTAINDTHRYKIMNFCNNLIVNYSQTSIL